MGRPAPSVHSEHTEYNLLQRHLKDRDQLEQDLPDGSADGYQIKEEEGRPDGTGSTECLLDVSSTPSIRGRATALNYQAELKSSGATVEGVEMEAVAAISGDCTQQDSVGGDQGGLDETKPQFRPPRSTTLLGGELEACKPKPPKPVKRESQHAHGRKSKKSKRREESCTNAHTSGTPLVLVNPAIPPSAVPPPAGYVTGNAFSSQSDLAQTRPLASILSVASSELAGNMPSLSTHYQHHCSRQQSALEEFESSHDPLQPRGLSTNSESTLPFSVHNDLPWDQNQFRKSTPGYIQNESIATMWKTQDNVGTGYLEGPPLSTMSTSKPSKISVEAIVEPLPAIQAELPNSIATPPATSELSVSALISLDPQPQQQPGSSFTTSQQRHNEGYHFIQGSMTDVPPSVPRSNPEFNLGELAEDYDDSASDTSSHNSVFEDLDRHGGYTPWTLAPHGQHRTRSEVTSGISSQSESAEPDGERLMRMLSEGYYSGPNTPVGKEHAGFSLHMCKTDRDSTSGISETLLLDSPGSERHSKDHSTSGISETLLSDIPGIETPSSSSGYVTSPAAYTENRNDFSFGSAIHSQLPDMESSYYTSSPPPAVSQQTLQKPSYNRNLPLGKAANQIYSIKTEGHLSLPFEIPKPPSVKSPPSGPSMVTLLSGSQSPSCVASPKSARIPLTSKLLNQCQTGNIDPNSSAPCEIVPQNPAPFLSAATTYTLPSLLGVTSSNTKTVFGSQTTQVTAVPETAVDSQSGNKLFDSEHTDHVKPSADFECHVSDKSYMPHGTSQNCRNYLNTANIDMDKIGFEFS